MLCGNKFDNLTGHVLHGHKMSPGEYRDATGYTGKFISLSHARNMQKKSTEVKKNDPELQEKIRNSIKNSYTPELRKLRSESTLAQWQNDEERKKKMDGVKKAAKKRYSPLRRIREQLYERAGNCCEKCGVSEDEYKEKSGRRLALHHLNYDKTVPELEDVMLVCQPCHLSIHRNMTNFDRFPAACNVIGQLLSKLKVNIEDENFVETPRRFATYLLEHFVDDNDIEILLEECKAAVFPNEYDNMVISKGIRVYGICPHHLLPIIYDIDLAYIPDETAIGLSKLNRIADLYGRQPLLQENLTNILADTLQDILFVKDVAVRISGEHMCISSRGVKAHGSSVLTSELRGSFKIPEVRNEFMILVKGL